MAQIQHCLMLCCCYQAFKLIKALKNFKAGICCVCFFLFRPNFLGSHHFSHHLSFGRNTQCKMASVSFSKLTGCSRIHVIIGRTIKAWVGMGKNNTICQKCVTCPAMSSILITYSSTNGSGSNLQCEDELSVATF